MRSRITSALVALLAVLALGAVAASGASAHEYFIEGKSMKERGLTEEAITSVGETGPAILRADAAEVSCGSVKINGAIKAGGGGAAQFSLTECGVVKPSNCAVEGSVVFQTSSGLVAFGSQLGDEFVIAPGANTSPLRFGNSGGVCPLGGAVWNAGGQVTSLVASEAENATGKLGFSTTTFSVEHSGFQLGGNSGEFHLKAGVKLSGVNAGKQWSAKN